MWFVVRVCVCVCLFGVDLGWIGEEGGKVSERRLAMGRETYGEGEGCLKRLGVFVWVAHVSVDLKMVSKLALGGGDDSGLTLGNTP